MRTSIDDTSDVSKKRPLFSLIQDGEDFAVFNKSSGIAVTGDRWDPALERLDKLAAVFLDLKKVFTVHRIDRDTSGLVLFAKTAEAHKRFSAAFEGRLVKKRYVVVVKGRPSWKETECDLRLVPNGNKLHHTIIDKYRGKPSLTRFRLLGSAGNYSVLFAFPETGRTHQIRVHLSALGHSVVCDEIYGNTKPVLLSAFKRGWRGDPLEERPLLSRLGLHAAELGFPAACFESGEELTLTAPLPRDMAALIKQMEKATGEGKFV
ncbi:MAG: RNA pseudouridine synthase [Treponema sp.]|jgi:23S rRNA pseudouridine1911/1915/1917 synthase|nr:RNA pseudouridine synthase [Treponema sp.]